MRRAWIPLLSIGVACVGLLLLLFGTPLLQPHYAYVWYLESGLIALAWSVLALVSIVVSIASLLLLLTRRQVRLWMSGIVVVLNVAVAIAPANILPWSLGSINTYRMGLAGYQKAAQACGHPPVLAGK